MKVNTSVQEARSEMFNRIRQEMREHRRLIETRGGAKKGKRPGAARSITCNENEPAAAGVRLPLDF